MLYRISCLSLGILLFAANLSADTIELYRIPNIPDEQTGHSTAVAVVTGPVAPFFKQDGPNQNDDQSDTHATSTASANAAVGFNTGYAMDVTDAYINVAKGATSFTPQGGVVTGGPMIATRPNGSVTTGSAGNGVSKADFEANAGGNIVGELTGTINITCSPGSHTFSTWTTTVTIGNSTITCDATGCHGVIYDKSVPGGSYSVSSSSAFGGSWNISEDINTPQIHFETTAYYGQGNSGVAVSEYPDFNGYGEFSVDDGM